MVKDRLIAARDLGARLREMAEQQEQTGDMEVAFTVANAKVRFVITQELLHDSAAMDRLLADVIAEIWSVDMVLTALSATLRVGDN